ncbi:MAG: ATP-binding cassette domain-containing protein [Bacteroidia bacterium]|nr:ATP-binding cassette domain-containing protein [Bacteroidia bacterium]
MYHSLYYAARLRLAADVTTDEINQKIDEILERLGIHSIKHALIDQISGGQRKRVSIAVELLSDPSILFLDEPTSPLDPETIEEFLRILRKLAASGTTILMVTHKPDDLDSADKVAFLSRGGYLVFMALRRSI